MPRFGGFRLAWTPILITYFSYGASAVTAIADVYLQKDTLGLTRPTWRGSRSGWACPGA